MIDDKIVLAVVTARAGSVGLPGKNYRPLLEKPLFLWSVNAALKSNVVDKVLVSSNCPHVESITQEIKNERVSFVKRPESLCQSLSKNEEALLHAVETYESDYGNPPDYIINLQPTSPLRLKNAIDDILGHMVDCNLNSALTVSAHTPLFLQQNEYGIKWHFNIHKRPMRQEMHHSEMYLHDDGNIYVTALDVLYDTMCRLDENPFVFVNDKYCSNQIDDLADFNIMEAIMKEVRGTNNYV